MIINGVEMLEYCRECRDESESFDVFEPADFIIWGKLAPPEKLGPRCYRHTEDLVGHMSRVDQWAIFDLRPFQKVAQRP